MCQFCFGWILGPLISLMRVGAIFKIDPEQNMSIFQRQNVNTLFAHVLFLREIDWQEVTQLFVCWWMMNWGRNTKQGRNQSIKLLFLCSCIPVLIYVLKIKVLLLARRPRWSFSACFRFLAWSIWCFGKCRGPYDGWIFLAICKFAPHPLTFAYKSK